MYFGKGEEVIICVILSYRPQPQGPWSTLEAFSEFDRHDYTTNVLTPSIVALKNWLLQF